MGHLPIRPFFLDVDAEDREYLHNSLDTILSSGTLILGKYTEQFEEAFAAYVGTRHAVSLNSATSALEVQLRLENVSGRQIAVPTNTNFATVAAIIHAGGIPVFLDMSSATFMPTLDMLVECRRRFPDLAGYVCVHIGGVIAPDMVEVAGFCEQSGLFLIEDCAHAHGSVLKGRHAGTFGVSGAYSFFPTKVMTTMEGGMIVTNNDAYADLVRSYRNQGKRAGPYNALHVDLGSSWRISEFAAAFGISQLRKLDEMIARRREVAKVYFDWFDRNDIQYVSTAHMDRCSYYKVIAISGRKVEDIKLFLSKEGIFLGGGVYEVPCHRQPVFADLASARFSYPTADALCSKQFCLPITSGMGVEDARRVVSVLSQCMQSEKS